MICCSGATPVSGVTPSALASSSLISFTRSTRTLVTSSVMRDAFRGMKMDGRQIIAGRRSAGVSSHPVRGSSPSARYTVRMPLPVSVAHVSRTQSRSPL
jgi:hypothetical protein